MLSALWGPVTGQLHTGTWPVVLAGRKGRHFHLKVTAPSAHISLVRAGRVAKPEVRDGGAQPGRDSMLWSDTRSSFLVPRGSRERYSTASVGLQAASTARGVGLLHCRECILSLWAGGFSGGCLAVTQVLLIAFFSFDNRNLRWEPFADIRLKSQLSQLLGLSEVWKVTPRAGCVCNSSTRIFCLGVFFIYRASCEAEFG